MIVYFFLSGVVGPRFQRANRMEYEDIIITEQQNTLENGYGEEVTPTTCLNVLKTTYVRNNQSAKHMWRQMWSEFYQVSVNFMLNKKILINATISLSLSISVH